VPVHPLRSGKHALCFGALLACVTGARLGREDQERLSGIVLSGVSLPAVPEPSDGIHVHRLDRQALFDHFMRIGKLPETFDRDSRMASLGVCAPPTSPGAAPSPSSAGGSVLTHCPVLPVPRRSVLRMRGQAAGICDHWLASVQRRRRLADRDGRIAVGQGWYPVEAAFDAVGPLLVIGWAEVGPGLIQAMQETGTRASVRARRMSGREHRRQAWRTGGMARVRWSRICSTGREGKGRPGQRAPGSPPALPPHHRPSRIDRLSTRRLSSTAGDLDSNLPIL